jgi:alpha-L-fucosidase 2
MGLPLASEASAVEQSSSLIADKASKALRRWYNEPAPDSDDGAPVIRLLPW